MAAEVRDPTVLVVDDERAVADAYTAQLEGDYDVRTAYGGEEALELVGPSVDVVLLDRRMPRLTGDEVLERISEMELACRVIMVTAVEPDFDIVEMPFDAYLQKPVDRTELVEAIDRQLAARTYDEQFDEFLAVTTKLGLLEEQKPAHELEQSEEVTALKERAAELKSDLDQTVMEFEESTTAFQDLV